MLTYDTAELTTTINISQINMIFFRSHHLHLTSEGYQLCIVQWSHKTSGEILAALK